MKFKKTFKPNLALKIKSTTLKMLPLNRLVTLRRNPQYLTPAQMESLKGSMRRDGFVVPILVRPMRGGKFEIISGKSSFHGCERTGA